MNNEQLIAYLKDESYLYTLSYEELKTLVVQYPYATNLRVLLLKKSYIEQNKDYERNLQMAAAYSTNRRFLYKLVRKLKTLQNIPENVILGEDYLELTELSNIEKMLEGRHVSEIYNDNTVALNSDLQLDWGGVEFGDNINISTDNSEDDSSDFIDLTMPFQTDISTEFTVESHHNYDENHHNYDEKEVDLAIEHILSEFGASALDKNDNPKEIPHPTEPLDFENLEDIREIPDSQEPENQIIDEEIKHFEELDDNREFIENQYFAEKKQENQDTHWQILEPISFEEESMMKKSDVEMEIVHHGKAIVIDSNPTVDATESPKLSFSEWLRQFKVTLPENITTTTPPKEVASPITPIVSTQNIDNKIITHTNIPTPTDNKHVLNESILALMFEKPQDLPDNLFGLNNPSLDKNEDYFADNLDELSEDEMPKKKKKKKHMHELAAKSIEENDDMISETLADILAWQGNYKKSIEMYKRLCLLIPEKSDYFAAKIEKLRNTNL